MLKTFIKSLLPKEWRYDLHRLRNRSHYQRLRDRVDEYADADGHLHRYSLREYSDNECIFIHIPKVAGISISAALFGTAGSGHRTARQYRLIFGRDFWRYYKFTFVRNPYARLVSAYDYLMKGGHPAWEQDRHFRDEILTRYSGFGAFVLSCIQPESDRWPYVHFRPQTEFLTLDGSMAVDFVGRYEALEEDFDRVARRLGKEVELPRKNRTPGPRKSLEAYYDNDKVIHRIQQAYEDDFADLGYSLKISDASNEPVA